jgi:hypothetical protein
MLGVVVGGVFNGIDAMGGGGKKMIFSDRSGFVSSRSSSSCKKKVMFASVLRYVSVAVHS